MPPVPPAAASAPPTAQPPSSIPAGLRPQVAPSSSEHGYVIAIDQKNPGGNAVGYINPDTGKPFGAGDPHYKFPVPMLAIVTHQDGFQETYQYDGRTPPDFPKGDFGTATGETGFDDNIRREYDTAVGRTTRPVGGQKGGYYTPDENGNYVQVIAPAATPPHVQVMADGSVMLITADGQYDFVRDANGNIVRDPLKVAEFADKLGISKESVLTAIQNREVQAGTFNLNAQNQAFNQGQTGFQNNVTIQNQAGSQAATDLANVLHLGIDLPAQTAANERAANLARSNEAVQRMTAAINGEATANVSGNNAVSDAQWMLQHGATPAFMGQLGTISGNVNAGALPNFGAPGMAIPMPDLAALRGSAQADTRARIPDFATALAQSQAQPVARPDMGALWNFYQGQRPYTNLYGGGVPLPYPTDIHPMLLQNPNMATIPYNPEPDPTTAPPYMGDMYYGGGVRVG